MKHLLFVYDWIGPNGPLQNNRIPNIYDLMKKVPYTQWDRVWAVDDQDPMGETMARYTDIRLAPTFDVAQYRENVFLYEYNLSMKAGYELLAFDFGHGLIESSAIDMKLLAQIRKKDGYLLISCPLESFLHDNLFYKMHRYFEAHKIPLDRIIYVNNCLNAKDIYEDFCLRHNEQPQIHCYYIGTYVQDFINRARDDCFVDLKYQVKEKEKTFLMFNRRMREQRIAFALRMQQEELLDEFFMSFPKEYSNFTVWQNFVKSIKDNESVDVIDMVKFFKTLPKVLDTGNFDRFPMEDDFFSPYHYYENSLISIVSETNFYSDVIHLTEKTMKPIMFKHPFIILGSWRSLYHLKSMGFKTFSDLWDESYDEEHDHNKRLNMIVDLCKSISIKTPAEKLELSEKMKPIVEYNFNILKGRNPVEIQKFVEMFGTE